MTQMGTTFHGDALVLRGANKLLILTGNPADSTVLKLRPCIFPHCEALCCYDGAYLADGEEDRIKAVVSNHPEHFKHLPGEYIVDGNWYNRVKGRKTAVRPFSYQSPDYPKHFNNTRCVFAYEDGRCSLQTAAQELNLHPWHFKPMACWLFPLRFSGSRITIPPRENEKDPDYINEDYPGFITFLPCGRHTEDGLPWYQALQKEIVYFLNMILGV
ncbi:MAG: hypothetical protein AB1507_05875 [Bacillota bacterium]